MRVARPGCDRRTETARETDGHAPSPAPPVAGMVLRVLPAASRAGERGARTGMSPRKCESSRTSELTRSTRTGCPGEGAGSGAATGGGASGLFCRLRIHGRSTTRIDLTKAPTNSATREILRGRGAASVGDTMRKIYWIRSTSPRGPGWREARREALSRAMGHCEVTGEPHPRLLVHHINGVSTDHRLENLLVVTPKVHYQIHNYPFVPRRERELVKEFWFRLHPTAARRRCT